MKYFSQGSFTMRPVGQDDLPLLSQHRNRESTWKGLTDIFPKFEHDQKNWLTRMGEKNLYFIVETLPPTYVPEGTIFISPQVGLARITDINFQNSNACVGLDIFEEHRGTGLAAPVFNMILKYSFDYLNLHRTWLLVKEDNMPAIKTYRRAGFRTEGKMRQHLYRDGKYYDYIMMGLLRDEWVDSSV